MDTEASLWDVANEDARRAMSRRLSFLQYIKTIDNMDF
jgi:hypothetical protein